MARATDADVRAVIDTDEDISMQPFITVANVIVNELTAADLQGAVSSSLLTQIEIYLAAHLYSLKDPALASESAGGASGQYQGGTNMFLEGTWWGQQAIFMDFSGFLARKNRQAQESGKPPLKMIHMGKHPKQHLHARERENFS